MNDTPTIDGEQPSAPERLAAGGRVLALLLFFIVPLGLRSYPLEHGGERGYVPDAHIVRNALGMAQEKNPVPPVGRFSTYPNLLPYMLLPVYGAQFFAGQQQELWDGPEEFGQHVLMNPASVHHPARWLVAILGSLTPLVVFAAAREARLGRGAWVAGWLVTTGLLQTQFCTQERPWAPMAMFMALTAWQAIRYVERGRVRSLYLSGLAAGLAFSTHQAGLLSLGITGLAWLIGPAAGRAPGWGTRIRQGFLAVGMFALLALVVGHPYLLVHGRTATESVVGGDAVREAGGVSIGGMSVVFNLSMDTLSRLSRVFVGYDPILLLLGLPGLLLALRRRSLLPPMIWTIAWGAFFLTNQSDHVRYLLPLAVLLAIPGGMAGEWLARSRAGSLALGVLLLLPLVQTARFAWVLERDDTRAQGEEAMFELPFAARIAVDRYGPAAELDAVALQRLQDIRQRRGSGLYARERHRKNQLLAGIIGYTDEGLDIVPIADLFAFDDRLGVLSVQPGLEELGATPAEVLAGLEVSHLVLVRRRPGDVHLLDTLLGDGEPLVVIDPGSGDEPAPEAFLPTEMDFPLTALWAVDRPGPRLEVYELQ